MPEPRRVLKWTVPVDDVEHPIGGGRVTLVACQYDHNTVQVWTEEVPGLHTRAAIVVGTGHPVPDGWEHIGSTVALSGQLVWHLYASPAR